MSLLVQNRDSSLIDFVHYTRQIMQVNSIIISLPASLRQDDCQDDSTGQTRSSAQVATAEQMSLITNNPPTFT